MSFKHSLLEEILNCPTAPFREHLIRELISKKMSQGNIPHFVDSVGNIVVGASSSIELKKILNSKSKKPVFAFIAHMDHPGLHLKSKLSSHKNLFCFRWHGGGPIKGLKNAPIWLADLNGHSSIGEIVSFKSNKSKTQITEGVLKIADPEFVTSKNQKEIFGGLHFKQFAWQSNSNIYTKAADDLAGVYSIAKLFLDLNSMRSSLPIVPIGILTIAEEVGWVGCLAHFKAYSQWKKSKRKILAISLEASRTLPRARIGGGPVVRLGDKISIFDPAYSEALFALAQKVCHGKVQKWVMNGGTCEGSVTQTIGIPTIALCVPLGNYHNTNFEGGPRCSKTNQGPAPEFINLDDLEGMVLIIKALCLNGLSPSHLDFKAKKLSLFARLDKYQTELKKSLLLIK